MSRMVWLNRRLLLVVALLLAVGGTAERVHGQGQQPQVSIRQVSDESGALTVVADVLDAAGRPVPGLPADAFELRLDGQPVPVREVRFAADAQTGMAVVLAIDVSGSMAGERIARARTAASAFLDTLEPADQVALITFNQTVTTLSDFTGDRAALKRQIAGLGATGNTALFDATIAAVNRAAAAPLTRKTVVLLSDGENFDPAGRTTREAAVDAARRGGVPVYAIGLGAELDRPYLDDLAQVTRGQTLHAPAPADLERLFRGIGESLRGQYIVQGAPPAVRRVAAHTVQLSVRQSGATTTAETSFPGTRLATLPDPTATPAVTAVATSTPLPAATPPPQPTPVFAGTPVAAPVVEETPAEGSSIAVPLLAGFVVLMLAAAGGAWLLARRRRNSSGDIPLPAPYEPTDTAPVPMPQGAALAPVTPAELVVSGGPLAGLRVRVAGEPVTIGTGDECRVVLPPDGNATERRYARVWHRDGRFMLHRLARGQSVTMEGRPVQWVVLEPGDEFAIGPHLFRFQINGPNASA
jgi:VWFA-related protein